MAVNYQLFGMPNSTQVPRYAGSAVPEMFQAARELQGRYDASRDTEDAMDLGIQNAVSTPQDAKELSNLKDEFKGRMQDRAKRGDYENMYRETARDAREFVNRYRPIAQNHQAVQEYYKDLQDKVEKGDLSKDWADKLFDASTRGYSGLKKDPVTGQYTNQFRGITAVKNINMEDWVDKALKGLDPQKIGADVRRDEGGFYHEVGGTKEYLDMDRIRPALKAAMDSDPMFQAYARQKSMLDSYQAKYTDEDMWKDSPMYNELKAYAHQRGLKFQDVAQDYLANTSQNQLMFQIEQIGSKYMKNNYTTIDKNMGMDEENAARMKKRIDDEAPDLGSFMIRANLAGNKIANPDELSASLHNAGQQVVQVSDARKKFEIENGVKPVNFDPTKPGGGPNARYVDKNGRDVTDIMQKNIDLENQAHDVLLDLAKRQERAMQAANYNVPEDVQNFATKMKNAVDAHNGNINAALTAVGSSGIPNMQGFAGILKTLQNTSDKLAGSTGQDVYNRIMQDADPAGYRRYQASLKADAENRSEVVGAKMFKSKAANEYVQNMVKTLSQDLDIHGLQSGLIPFEKMDGSKFDDEDYAKAKQKTEFGGYIVDPSTGQYKMIVKLGEVRYDAKGKPVGDVTTAMTDAPTKIQEYLARTGEVDAAKQFIAQSIGNAHANTEDKEATYNLDPATGQKVTLRRLTKSEKDDPKIIRKYGNITPEFIAEFSDKSGNRATVTYNSSGEAANAIGDIINTIAKGQKH